MGLLTNFSHALKNMVSLSIKLSAQVSKNCLEVYSQAWEVIDFVEKTDLEADRIMDDAANRLLYTLKGSLPTNKLSCAPTFIPPAVIKELAMESEKNADLSIGHKLQAHPQQDMVEDWEMDANIYELEEIGIPMQIINSNDYRAAEPKCTWDGIGGNDSIDWKEVAIATSAYKLCESIDCNFNMDLNVLLKEIECLLADIICTCLHKIKSSLIVNSTKWARNVEEDKLGRALYTAGKAKVLMEKLDDVAKIKRLLERNGARRSARAVEETTEKSTNSNAQIVSVNAVLIATVAFAAAFTLPKDDDKYTVFFQITVICDALAFCTSISSAVLLMYALDGKQEDPLLLNSSITGLWIALISLLLAFGAVIFNVVAPKHGAVAGTVLVIVSIVPICIRMMIFRSKKYIFREDEHHLWTLVIVSCLQIILFFTLAFKTNITPPQVLGVVVGLMVVWIAASLGPPKWFLSRRHVSKDNGHYIWFLVIGAIMNLIFISYLIFIVYLYLRRETSNKED